MLNYGELNRKLMIPYEKIHGETEIQLFSRKLGEPTNTFFSRLSKKRL